MNNKIIGIVIGVLILGVVIFAGMNNPQMSPPLKMDQLRSTGPTFPSIPDELFVYDPELECESLFGVLTCDGFYIDCDKSWDQDGDEWYNSGDCDVIIEN